MNDTAASQQNTLHKVLDAYVNGGCFSRADKVCSILSERLPFTRNAARVCGAHHDFRTALGDYRGPATTVSIAPYRGQNQFVRRMTEYLDGAFRNELVGAYVHGSLATEEEIEYSDFDALVIIRDHVFQQASALADVALRLSRARTIMLESDPLQHHGWFVLTESDLRFHSDATFPQALFAECRSLMSAGANDLALTPRPSTNETRAVFNQLASSCLQMIRRRPLPVTAYQTKCMLSQFMLLPALYLQTRDGDGIAKKRSFEVARLDFTPQEWTCMDHVSAIRERWHIPMSRFDRMVLQRSALVRTTVTKSVSPKTPENIQVQLTPQLLEQMGALITRMQDLLNTKRPSHLPAHIA